MQRTVLFILLAALLGSSGATAVNTNINPVWSSKSKHHCSAREKAEIQLSLLWLLNSMDRIDEQMGNNGLMDWPGNSREKFVAKLSKPLKFGCLDDDHRLCKKNILGRAVPILHQRRILMCMNDIEREQMAMVISHEVAHLVRFNIHRFRCERRYTRPRFSQSVGLAAFYGFNGGDYNAQDWIDGAC